MEELKKYFQDKKVTKILDVGCGAGDFINVLSDVFSESKITGIDPFEEPLAEARKNYASERIDFLQMSGEQIEFENESFDVVAISFALHHLADVSKTLSEMKRVVKPNGWLIINEIVSDIQNEAQKTQQMQHHLKGFVDRLNGIPHRETYSEEEVKSVAAENGISIDYSFTNLKVKEPRFEPEFFQERTQIMTELVDALKDHESYPEKKLLLEEFKERLPKYGFQIAPSVVIVGRK